MNERTITFKSDVAELHGLDCAILYSYIEYWCRRNGISDEGEMYATYQSLENAMPWYSRAKIRRTIEKLKKKKLITARLRTNREVRGNRSLYLRLGPKKAVCSK